MAEGRVTAQELREFLLDQADLAAASSAAGDIANQVNDLLNARADRRELTVASSLLARALIARAVIAIAAAWWADVMTHPEPETFRALRTIVDELPAELDGYVLEKGEVEHG